MPRCFPQEPEFPEDRRAERAVWEALCEQLPDGAALFHSVQLKERNSDFEADLIVAWPGVGFAVIEVKGGRVSFADGQWLQSDRQGSHRIDPVLQAEDCKNVLIRHLRQRGNPSAQTRFAHLVAFPYSEVPEDWELPGCPRGMVIDRGDLQAAASIVQTAIERFGKGTRAASDDDVERFVATMSESFGSQTRLLAQVAEHEIRVDQMTRDQVKTLRSLRLQRRLKVIGGAGTGKTWLALEQARRLTESGERVALVCYSRGLGHFLQRVVATWKRDERPAYVGLFHSLPLAWGAELPPVTDDLDVISDYYERRLPQQLGELALSVDAKERFDSIVVDEAQDFGDAWWPPTLASLRDQDSGGLFAFLDDAQRIFNRFGEVPIPLPPFPLDENIRNTKRIAQTFGSLATEQNRYLGLEGPPIRFVECAAEDAIEAADDAVERLVDEGWKLGDIALLTTGRRHPVQVESAVDYGDWGSYWDEFFAGKTVFYGHVLGFKGLERSAVVLAVNGIRDEDRAREYLYVGLSRARTQLVVCGDLEQMSHWGGEGLRRRLMRAEL